MPKGYVKDIEALLQTAESMIYDNPREAALKTADAYNLLHKASGFARISTDWRGAKALYGEKVPDLDAVLAEDEIDVLVEGPLYHP